MRPGRSFHQLSHRAAKEKGIAGMKTIHIRARKDIGMGR
jgi:hypothetical protein